MGTLLDLASLVVVPSGYKAGTVYSVVPTDGAGDLTFTRALDTATRVGPDGLIEKVRTNVSLYSEDQTNWTISNATNVTANAAANPLNGAVTADKVIPTAVLDDHYRGLTMATMNGEITASIFVKADGYNFIDFGIFNATAANYPVRATFDLSTQTFTFTNGSIASITAAGSGYFRISISASVASASSIDLYHRVRPTGGTGTFTGNGTSGMLLWGCQLESGVMTPYIGPTTTAAVSVGMLANVPRLDYTGGGCPKLLLEPQRTNLVTFSEQLNTGSGGTSAVTANTQVSPDGYTNADTIGAGYWTKSTSQAAGTYTLSVFAKYQSTASVLLYIYDGAYYQGSFNLQTGVATSSTGSPSVSMVSYGNGWYRCIVTATTASTISEVGFGSGNFYGYGLQFELGSYATSYIPTLAAAVTRSADAASKTGISALIGGTSGTIFFEIKTNKTLTATNFKQFFYYTDAASAQAYMYINSSNQIQTSPSLANFVGSLVLVADTTYKVALAYALNDFKLFIDGVDRGGSVSGATFNAVNLASLGSFNGASEFNEFTFKQYLHFPTRLTNALLAQLTTI